MRRTLILPVAAILAALALSGCSAGTANSSDYAAPVPDGGAALTSPGVASEADGTKADTALAAATDRAVIVTGYVTVTVDSPRDAADEAIRITEQVGGRVDGRTESAPVGGDKGSATLTLRLPADGLNATIDKLTALGEVQEISLSSQDVTAETQDIDARITALRASVDRLLALLEKASDTDTLITLESAISDRQSQLESLESQQRYYADQVALSTVTLNLISVADTPVREPDTFLSGLAAGWNALLGFFGGLAVVLGVLLPWLVLAGIITAIVLVVIRLTRRARASRPSAPATPPEAP